MALHKKSVTYSKHSTRAARAAHAKGDKQFRHYDTSALMPRKSPLPIIVAIVLLVALIGGGFFAYKAFFPAQVELLEAGQTAQVVIEEGESATSIADALVEARLIAKASEFTDEVKALEAESSLVPGTYTFEGGETPEQLVRAIMAGPESTGDKLTVPEDMTLKNVAPLVEEATDGRITADDFTNAASDASVYAKDYPFLESAGTNSLEGFLFPKTYAITSDMNAEEVVRMMLDQFQKETASLFDNFDSSYPAKHNLTIYDAVKLASIVAKESTGNQEVRDHVAGVFYNRLASDRPYLESDATTAYEVGHDPTSEEVHADTPYSTYTNEGLPPTPICSPGIESLTSVFEPTETDDMFFYFYTDANGTVQYVFSKTYAEHQKAIEEHPSE